MPDASPIFADVFGDQWEHLPEALKRHYANRPFSRDVVGHEGKLTIAMSPLMRRFRWLLRLSGLLVPFEGVDVPVTVYTRSDPTSKTYIFERHFFPPGGPEYVFRSQLVCVKPHVVIEYFRFGGGWRATYQWDGDKVVIRHDGFNWRLFGLNMPLPGFLDFFFGRGGAWEQAVSDDAYRMETGLRHILHRGKLMGYAGTFHITGVTLAE